jgi:hypothetical protein
MGALGGGPRGGGATGGGGGGGGAPKTAVKHILDGTVVRVLKENGKLDDSEYARYNKMAVLIAFEKPGVTIKPCPRMGCSGFSDELTSSKCKSYRCCSSSSCDTVFCSSCGATWDPEMAARSCATWRDERDAKIAELEAAAEKKRQEEAEERIRRAKEADRVKLLAEEDALRKKIAAQAAAEKAERDAKNAAAKKQDAVWLAANTKPCPRCFKRVHRLDGCLHVSCAGCNTAFNFCCSTIDGGHSSRTCPSKPGWTWNYDREHPATDHWTDEHGNHRGGPQP